MFNKARKELHKRLKKYTFSLVSRGVTIPPDCMENGEVTHYYTTSEELQVGTQRKGGSVWLKKKARSRQVELGPVVFTSSEELPKAGDVVFGELYQVANSERKFGKQSVKADRQSYRWWMCPGTALYYLATMVLKGTSETEDSLRALLKLCGGYDDLWMLARLVLFNNIQCFVEVCMNSTDVKLRESPAVLVQQLSVWLDDFTILSEFQKRMPDQRPTGPPPPTRQFVGRKRSQEYNVSYNANEYNPAQCEFDFSHRRPAGPASPPYVPASPPYAAASPPYVPASPPYAAASPPYAAASPPYAPASPPYAPASPPYAPSSRNGYHK